MGQGHALVGAGRALLAHGTPVWPNRSGIPRARGWTDVDGVNFCQQCGARLAVELVDGLHRPRCPACRLVVFLDPKVVAVGLVSRDQQLLFIRRNVDPGRGLWALPGGFVERGEPVEEAVRREVREETGLSVSVDGLVGLYSESGSPIVLAAYAASYVEGDLAGDPAEVQETAFFPVDSPPPLAFPRDRRIIQDWQGQGPRP